MRLEADDGHLPLLSSLSLVIVDQLSLLRSIDMMLIVRVLLNDLNVLIDLVDVLL